MRYLSFMSLLVLTACLGESGTLQVKDREGDTDAENVVVGSTDGTITVGDDTDVADSDVADTDTVGEPVMMVDYPTIIFYWDSHPHQDMMGGPPVWIENSGNADLLINVSWEAPADLWPFFVVVDARGNGGRTDYETKTSIDLVIHPGERDELSTSWSGWLGPWVNDAPTWVSPDANLDEVEVNLVLKSNVGTILIGTTGCRGSASDCAP